MKIIVLCAKRDDGVKWCIQHKFGPHECSIVSSELDMALLDGIEVSGMVMLPGFFELENAFQLYSGSIQRVRGR